MFTKLLISFVCVLTLALVATSYGVYTGPVVLGNWEMYSNTPWDFWGSTTTANLFGLSKTGATLGSYSLKKVGPSSGWAQDLTLHLEDSYEQVNGQLAMDWWRNNPEYTTFQIDITRLVAEWLPDQSGNSYSKLLLVLEAGGFKNGVGQGVWSATDGWSGANSGWDPMMGDAPITAQYNLADLYQQVTNIWNDGYTDQMYCHFDLITQDGGYLGNVTYYFDNAKLVPEPATIALLGLGGLSLIRRKR